MSTKLEFSYPSDNKWIRFKDRALCSRPGLIVNILLGWPVCYRMKFKGPVMLHKDLRHARVTRCLFDKR